MIVDVHSHVWHTCEQWGPQIGSLLRKRLGSPVSPPDASGQAHSEAMQTVGAAFVLGFRSKRLGVELPLTVLSSHTAWAPDRMAGFAGVDPMEDGYLDLVEGIPARRMKGVVISPSEQGFHPQHSRAMRLYELCQTLGLPVIVHQGEDFVRDSMMEFAQPHLLDGVARDFPRLKILLTHCGHPWTDQALVLLGKHPHVYTEISGLTLRPKQLHDVLLQACQMDVIDKVLFGSDFPRQTPQEAIRTIYSLNQWNLGDCLVSLPREKLRGIVERGALALLGVSLAAPKPAAQAKPAA